MMQKTYIIAEAGVNHNGSEDRALEMIHAAKKAGADAVKFQLFNAESLVTEQAEQATYQKQNAPMCSQYEMLKALELSYTSFERLHAQAIKIGIDFIVTPFDLESLAFIDKALELPLIKIGSGDITNGPLLLAAARTGKKIILSTGMSTLGEIEDALKVIAYGYIMPTAYPTKETLDNAYMNAATLLREKIVLLHCTSEYPTPLNEVNLRAMDTLNSAFGLEVGLSDHTLGIEVALAAVAREAVVIEKHFTLDKTLAGPDHVASLNMEELMAMIMGIRNIENALGDGRKYPRQCEIPTRVLVRRSIVATQKISAGDIFATTSLSVKRPCAGRSAMDYWEFLGKVAQKSYEKDEIIL